MQLDVNRRKRLTSKYRLYPAGRLTWRSGPSCPAALLFAGSAFAADDRLSLLNAEEGNPETGVIEGLAVSRVLGASVLADSRVNVSRGAFESQLKQTQLGAHSFYKKLPEHRRQEICLEYFNGAPITRVRKRIVDRLRER